MVYVLSLPGMASAHLVPTVSWSSSKVIVSCVLPTQHVSSNRAKAAVEKDVLLLEVQKWGTTFQHIGEKLALTLNSLWAYRRLLKILCSGAEIVVYCH